MGKLLVICGPTAVGKTALALHLSKVLDGELLSADSRQVYKGMDIVTGKGVPEDGTKIWLTDLANPKDEFSVSQWGEAAVRVLGDLGEREKLPILVGGTGFYIKALLDGIETIDIPQNKELRSMLISKTADELFEILSQLDSARSANMNQSDRKNPRRLVRAIEIGSWNKDKQSLPLRGRDIDKDKGKIEADILIIGLRAPREVLRQRIEKRIDKMLEEGALEEVKRLVETGVPWDTQSMSSIGYQKFRDYFAGKITSGEVKEKWVEADLQYARRQMTWFKKDKRIKWFNITKAGWQKKVEKKILDWYNRNVKA